MTNHTIQNFQYFLEELDKNLRSLDELFEKEFIHLKNMHVLHSTMSKMCQNWSNQLEYRE